MCFQIHLRRVFTAKKTIVIRGIVYKSSKSRYVNISVIFITSNILNDIKTNFYFQNDHVHPFLFMSYVKMLQITIL